MLARVASLGGSREDCPVRPPEASELLDRIRALPAGRPLIAAVDNLPGVHLVGGAVRDLLLGGVPFDLDLVVEGEPVPLARRLGDDVVVHDRFGTSTVSAGGYSYDLARARRETYPHPGALPEVTPAGLAEDLGRRDFTVNAMAITLGAPAPGKLTALRGAIDDLDARTLRVLHDESFIDDPTRLLRLARYHARLGFSIDPHTRSLAGDAVSGGALDTLTGARIGHELRLLAREHDPVAALRAVHELELDRALHPGFGLEEEEPLRRALALLGPDDHPDRLALGAAASRMSADELRALIDRLGFEARDREAIQAVANRAPELSRALAGARRPSEIARVASAVVPEAIALAGALGAEDAARSWLDELRAVALQIDGGDLLAAGIPEGPAIGHALEAALAAKLDGLAPGRREELAAALESLGDRG